MSPPEIARDHEYVGQFHEQDPINLLLPWDQDARGAGRGIGARGFTRIDEIDCSKVGSRTSQRYPLQMRWLSLLPVNITATSALQS